MKSIWDRYLSVGWENSLTESFTPFDAATNWTLSSNFTNIWTANLSNLFGSSRPAVTAMMS